MNDISKTSKQEAKDFAHKYSLLPEAEQELAILLEKTWQDGVRAEQVLRQLEEVVG